MLTERRRDNQQWLLDYLVKVTGRVQNFANDEREVPPEVKSYDMISRVLEKHARQKEHMALAAERASNVETARELFWAACQDYIRGQHNIYQDDNPEKIYLHAKLLECYDHLIASSDYPLERVEVPWDGRSIQGLFHTFPDHRRAPTILLVPGMDLVKESYPRPLENLYLSRGFNVLAIDGPGQGMSNIRKIRVDADNYAAAGSACIDWLLTRPEVDPERIGLLGLSMGTYWAPLIATKDRRVRACASSHACYGDKTPIFEQASPRFKQMFMYMSGIHDEDAFDRMAREMTLVGRAKDIHCPMLMVTGEYDPLCTLEDTLKVYDELRVPKELWVLENEFHRVSGVKGFGGVDVQAFMVDWLRQAVEGRLPADHKREVLIPQTGLGPYQPESKPIFLPGRASG